MTFIEPQEQTLLMPVTKLAIPTSSRGSTVTISSSSGTFSGAGNLAPGAGGRTFLAGGWKQLIRCPGTVTGCRVYIGTGSPSGNITFRIFRWDGSAWDQVGSDSNATNMNTLNVGAWNTIAFSSTIAGALPGDVLAVHLANGATTTLLGVNVTGSEDYTLPYAEGDITGADQTFGLELAGYSLGLEARMDSPVWVFCGDSIAGGTGATYELLQDLDGSTWEPDSQTLTDGLCGKLYTESSTLFPGLNHGYGSTDSNDWATTGNDYITTHCTAYLPQLAMIELGLNDIGNGVSWATYIANMENILTELRTHSITPVILGLTPFHGGTTAQKATRRLWDEKLRQWCAHSSRRILYIDVASTIAKPSDIDSIRTASPSYYSTGVHPNAAGYTAMAKQIAAQIVAAE